MYQDDYMIAGNIQTPKSKLAELMLSEQSKVRIRVAENPRTPMPVLTRLIYDPDSEVRLSVANNPNVTFALLEWLVIDESSDVRFGLAENHHLPDMLLKQLSLDENPYVAERAKQTQLALQSERLRLAYASRTVRNWLSKPANALGALG
jgi:hypothetical protein